MAQAFSHPNLLSGTRSGEGWMRGGSGAGGDYNAGTGIELYNDGSSECSLYSPLVVLHTGTDYTLSCFAANTDNMKGTKWCVINKATGSLAAYRMLDSPGPGGIWLTEHINLWDNAEDGGQYFVRFDNEGATDGERCTIWFRDIMLTDGTKQHAWAPAEGETLVGVGARMSANALDGITPELLSGTTKNGIWYETTAGGDCLRYPLDISAHRDNQAFNLAATVCGDSAGWISLSLEYADAAGRTNRAIERLDFATEPARRKVSIVVPSGMAVKALYVSRDESQPASRVAHIALWQGELIADYGLVLDVGTNVDIALDVRAGYR